MGDDVGQSYPKVPRRDLVLGGQAGKTRRVAGGFSHNGSIMTLVQPTIKNNLAACISKEL